MIPPLKALGLALLCTRAQALYFYMPGPVEKCFFEVRPAPERGDDGPATDDS